MDNPITTYLSDSDSLDSSAARVALDSIVELYPWFTLGRYMQVRALRAVDQDRYRRHLKDLATVLTARPYPQIMLEYQYRDNCDVETRMEQRLAPIPGNSSDTLMAIDHFLSRDPGRIPPPPIIAADEQQEDISIPSITPHDDIVTETLARVYLLQGHVDLAIEIYYKLSLKYPEKSSYFADLIAKAQDGINA